MPHFTCMLCPLQHFYMAGCGKCMHAGRYVTQMISAARCQRATGGLTAEVAFTVNPPDAVDALFMRVLAHKVEHARVALALIIHLALHRCQGGLQCACFACHLLRGAQALLRTQHASLQKVGVRCSSTAGNAERSELARASKAQPGGKGDR